MIHLFSRPLRWTFWRSALQKTQGNTQKTSDATGRSMPSAARGGSALGRLVPFCGPRGAAPPARMPAGRSPHTESCLTRSHVGSLSFNARPPARRGRASDQSLPETSSPTPPWDCSLRGLFLRPGRWQYREGRRDSPQPNADVASHFQMRTRLRRALALRWRPARGSVRWL